MRPAPAYPVTVVVPGMSVPHQGWLDTATKPLFSAFMYQPHDFGKDLAKSCGWYMKAEKTSFVAVSSQPWCGTDLPGTTTVSG